MILKWLQIFQKMILTYRFKLQVTSHTLWTLKFFLFGCHTQACFQIFAAKTLMYEVSNKWPRFKIELITRHFQKISVLMLSLTKGFFLGHVGYTAVSPDSFPPQLDRFKVSTLRTADVTTRFVNNVYPISCPKYAVSSVFFFRRENCISG